MGGPVPHLEAGISPMTMGRSTIWAASLFLLLGLPMAASAQKLQPFSTAGDEALPPPWRIVGLPNGKTLTRLEVVSLNSERVLRLASDKSYGNALHELASVMPGPGSTLRWRWRLEQPLTAADLKRKEGDDVAIKVCLLFDMPLEKLGLVDRSILRLARTMSSENLPAATLCYVWDHLLPAGSEFPNAYTQRLRFVVLDSGEKQLGQWVTHERDIAADFQRAFGHETDVMPPLIGVAVGADSDNTRSTSLAYLGDLTLTIAPSAVNGPPPQPVKQ